MGVVEGVGGVGVPFFGEGWGGGGVGCGWEVWLDFSGGFGGASGREAREGYLVFGLR